MPIIPKPSGGGGPALSNTVPVADGGAGSAGVAATASRGDHQHPASGGGSSTVKALAVLTNIPDITAAVYEVFASNPSDTVGPVLIAANTAQVGDQITGYADYFMTGDTAGQTIAVNFFIGSNNIGPHALTLPASFSGFVRAEFRANIRIIGASGKFTGAAWIKAVSNVAPTFAPLEFGDFADRGIDTTVDQTVEIEIRGSSSGGGYDVLELSAAMNIQKFS